MYALPIDEQISWEGHLSGLITGFIFALFFRKEIMKPKKYAWEAENYNEENDEFLKHFDENGNFIEHLEEDQLEDSIKINYTYKEEEK